jgi:hypothetical protein
MTDRTCRTSADTDQVGASMSSQLDSLRIAALVAFLTVVGVMGSSWTGEAASATTVMNHGGIDVLIAVGSLQLLGVLTFEGMALVRRRSERRAVIPVLAWPVPTPYTFQAPESTSQTRRAA